MGNASSRAARPSGRAVKHGTPSWEDVQCQDWQNRTIGVDRTSGIPAPSRSSKGKNFDRPYSTTPGMRWCYLSVQAKQAAAPWPATARGDAPAAGLLALPLELLELICATLTIPERVALTSCCYALWMRPDVLTSPVLWGELEQAKAEYYRHSEEAVQQQLSLAAWLGRHRIGLRRLVLNGEPLNLAEVLRSLGGSPLQELSLSCEPGMPSAPPAALRPLSQLTALTRLDARWCGLREVPLPLVALTALVCLDLGGNGGIGQGGEAALRPLRHLTALTRLDLGKCGLRGAPPQLAAMPALRELDLSGNYSLGGGDCDPLCHLGALTWLDLGLCGLEALPLQLTALTALADLGLTNNAYLGKGVEDDAFQALLPLAGSLTCLDLSFCGLDSLPRELKALKALVHLSLATNHALGETGESAFQPLRRLPALQHLNLHGCGLKSVPRQLEELPALAELDLAVNDRLWVGGEAQPLEPLQRMPALRRLDVRSRALPGLPTQLAGLRSRGVEVCWAWCTSTGEPCKA